MADEIETKTTEEVEEKETAPEGPSKEEIAEAIQELLDDGASEEEVLDVVEKAIEDGKLPESALEIAHELLEADSEKADGLFGIK